MDESIQSRGINCCIQHNVINLYFTANKTTMYAIYHGKVYRLL